MLAPGPIGAIQCSHRAVCRSSPVPVIRKLEDKAEMPSVRFHGRVQAFQHNSGETKLARYPTTPQNIFRATLCSHFFHFLRAFVI